MILLSIISFIISAIFNAEMDVISFKPDKAWFKGWWVNKDYKFSFWLKVPFSFLENGWHFCKGVVVFTFLVPFSALICVHHDLGYWHLIIINIVLYAIHGIIFEIIYKR